MPSSNSNLYLLFLLQLVLLYKMEIVTSLIYNLLIESFLVLTLKWTTNKLINQYQQWIKYVVWHYFTSLIYQIYILYKNSIFILVTIIFHIFIFSNKLLWVFSWKLFFFLHQIIFTFQHFNWFLLFLFLTILFCSREMQRIFFLFFIN